MTARSMADALLRRLVRRGTCGEGGGVNVSTVLLNIIRICGEWNPAELRMINLAVNTAMRVVSDVSDLHYTILKKRVPVLRVVLAR